MSDEQLRRRLASLLDALEGEILAGLPAEQVLRIAAIQVRAIIKGLTEPACVETS